MDLPAPRTLLEILQERLTQSSKTTLRQLLRHDQVLVNGRPERNAKRAITSEDHVAIAGKETRLDPRLRILFEDADIVVVDKPAGLLSVPSDRGRFENAENLLNVYLGARPGEKRIHHVHRLDRDTSGVLVFAKNAFSYERLKEQFELHSIERVYVALVHGKLPKPSGTIRSYLAEGRDLRVRVVADPALGKEAITHYKTLRFGGKYSLLELRLETGRRNQIRVQLSNAGHPVLGDTMYGKGLKDPLRRLGLHAKSLGLNHPRSNKRILWTTEIPAALRSFELSL